jgi:small-conductance mechanosensitive channel
METEWLHRSYLGNTLIQYGTALGILAGGLLVIFVFKYVFLRRAEAWAARTKTAFDDFMMASVRKTLVPLLYYGVLYLSLNSLSLNPGLAKAFSILGKILVAVAAVRFVLQSIQFGLQGVWLRRKPEAADMERHARAFMPVVSVIVWSVGVLFLLDNLGFKISTLVAGLGIGGVALALASQTMLSDMFSYFAIMMDRPFELDDFIIINDFMGTVEHIGIKTTRIRSLGGEQLVLSNKDLTESRIRNYKRMQLRRVDFKLGLIYNTPVYQLEKAANLLKQIVSRVPQTRFDRAHFSSYGDHSLVYEVVYYVLSADYNLYMDIQQGINLAIKETFERENIYFAFPGQVLQPKVLDEARV